VAEVWQKGGLAGTGVVFRSARLAHFHRPSRRPRDVNWQISGKRGDGPSDLYVSMYLLMLCLPVTIDS
jgi:hypothetical protein